MRAVAVLIVVGFAGLAPGSLGDHAVTPCLGWRLPAPITIAAPIYTKSGNYLRTVRYRIGCDGRVRPMDAIRSPFTSGAPFGWVPGIFAVEVSPRAEAFSYDNNLYLAPVRGAERLIGRQEYPLGFTSAGLYTISWLGGLLLRSDSGTIVKTFTHWTQQYFATRGSLYFIARGLLMRARGARIQRLASLARLGMSPDVGLQALSTDPWSEVTVGLLELEDNNRLTVLRPDGSVFATASSREWGGGGISSQPVVAPRGAAVAFTATSGEPNATGQVYATAETYATETVYVLRAGWRRAAVLLRKKVHFGVCTGVGTTLQWHGNWMLYSDSNGNLAAIDTGRAHHAIELTGLVRKLRGVGGGFNAYWSEQPPPSY